MANGLWGVGGAPMLAGSPGAMGAGEPAVNGTIYIQHVPGTITL